MINDHTTHATKLYRIVFDETVLRNVIRIQK